MVWQSSPYTLPLFAVAALTLGLAVLGLRRPGIAGSRPFTLLMLSVAVWSFGYALENAAAHLSGKLFWARVEYIGIVTVPVTWLAFAFDYTGYGPALRRSRRLLLFIPSLIILGLAWTNQHHGLLWRTVWVEVLDSFTVWNASYGPAFWLHVTYAYALLASGSVVLLRWAARSPGLYREQTLALLLAALAPWVGNILYVGQLTPFAGLDLTVFAFAISGLAIAWAVLKVHLLDVVPIARAAIVESMRDAVVVLDGLDRVVDLNPSAERVLGLTSTTSVGRPAAEILPDWDRCIRNLDNASPEAPDSRDEITLKVDGLPRTFDVRVSPLGIQKHRRLGRLVVMRDIDALVRAENALRAAHAELEKRVTTRTAELARANRQLAEEVAVRQGAEAALAAEKERLDITLRSIGDGVITTDTSGRIGLMNPVAETLTGWSAEAALGRDVEEVFLLRNLHGRASVDNPVWRVLRTGEQVPLASGHSRLIARDGTERVIADSAAPIRGSDGVMVGVVLVFGDVTQQRRMEDELARASKLESVGVLAGGIAHDFNNILTAVMANLSLVLISAPLDERTRQRLQEAERASVRAKGLTQQLLTFAKGGTPIRKPVALAPLLIESTSLALSGSSSRAEFDIDPDLWSVEADEGQVGQVVQNLVLNAAQAMPGGGTIEIRAENFAPGAGMPQLRGPSDCVRISVRDVGQGIPPEHLPRIFDPFFSTKAAGTGLGLSTAYSIVQKHGGYIGVESTVGEGTRFDVYLPASSGTPSGEHNGHARRSVREPSPARHP